MEKMKMSEETRIKLPVRYDHNDLLHGHGVWRDADGRYLFEDFGNNSSEAVNTLTDDELRQRNQWVADSLNNSADLEAKIAEVEKERDAYAAMFKDVDIIQFGNGAITVCGSQQECWDVLNNQGETRGHFPSVLEAYAALTASGEEWDMGHYEPVMEWVEDDEDDDDCCHCCGEPFDVCDCSLMREAAECKCGAYQETKQGLYKVADCVC